MEITLKKSFKIKDLGQNKYNNNNSVIPPSSFYIYCSFFNQTGRGGDVFLRGGSEEGARVFVTLSTFFAQTRMALGLQGILRLPHSFTFFHLFTLLWFTLGIETF